MVASALLDWFDQRGTDGTCSPDRCCPHGTGAPAAGTPVLPHGPAYSLWKASLTAPAAFFMLVAPGAVPCSRSSGVVGGGIGTPAGGSAT